MMSLLLAMTLAATPAHAARLDQSHASVAAAGKLNDKIPYLLCQRICIGVRIWDRRPIESAECWCSRPCGDSTNSNKPAALLHASKEALQVKGKSEATVKSKVFPYDECAEKCAGICLCAAIWPPPATCLCAAPLIQSTSTVGEVKELHNKLDLLAGPVQKGASGDDKKMVVWTKGKMEAIPYEECIKTCEICACTLPWPPEASICICITSKLDVLIGPVQKGTSGDDKKMVVWTKGKMEAISYEECIKTCDICACTLPWPPEASVCICITSIPQVTGGKALAM